ASRPQQPGPDAARLRPLHAQRRPATRGGPEPDARVTEAAIGYSLATVGPRTAPPAENGKGHNLLRLRPLLLVGATGLEPVTPSVSSNGQPVASVDGEGVAASPPAVCTPVCTSPTAAANLDALAAALLGLSPEDRARLAALLLGKA